MSEFHLGCRVGRRAASFVAMTILGGATALAQPLAMTEPTYPHSMSQSPFDRVIVDPQREAESEAVPPATTPAHLRRQIVSYRSSHAPGTIVIDTPNTYLYYVLPDGRAVRYGIGVGREGFRWSGTQTVSRKQEWPDWHPPAEMIARQPYLPRFMSGGPGNPLGARAMYLGNTLYRIHGTSEPATIGRRVSSGCIRMLNEDVIDLYNRVGIGTRVVVLPDRNRAPIGVARAPAQRRAVEPAPAAEAAPLPAPHFARSTLHYGLSASRLY